MKDRRKPLTVDMIHSQFRQCLASTPHSQMTNQMIYHHY
jgi:hypothetical protein